MFSLILANWLLFADLDVWDSIVSRPSPTYEERRAQRYFWLWPASIAFTGAAIGLGIYSAARVNSRASSHPGKSQASPGSTSGPRPEADEAAGKPHA